MNISIFGLMSEVTGGLLIGVLFGFFLQKAGVTQFRTIKNQLLLKDFTVMKVILTAIASGSLGLFLYRQYVNPQPLIINTTSLKAAFWGGGIFGVGMATLGFCPGTCIGALAEKSKAAIWGFIGMIIGAFSYTKLASFFHQRFKKPQDMCKTTLNDLWNISPLFIIGCLLLIVVAMWSYDKKMRKQSPKISKK